MPVIDDCQLNPHQALLPWAAPHLNARDMEAALLSTPHVRGWVRPVVDWVTVDGLSPVCSPEIKPLNEYWVQLMVYN